MTLSEASPWLHFRHMRDSRRDRLAEAHRCNKIAHSHFKGSESCQQHDRSPWREEERRRGNNTEDSSSSYAALLARSSHHQKRSHLPCLPPVYCLASRRPKEAEEAKPCHGWRFNAQRARGKIVHQDVICSCAPKIITPCSRPRGGSGAPSDGFTAAASSSEVRGT
jgi:hypothetical protein